MALDAHRRANWRQTLGLIAGLALLVGLCGYVLAGRSGLWVALSAVVIIVLSTNRMAVSLVLRMYRAEPLGDRNAPELMQMFRALCSRARLPFLPRLYHVPSPMLNAFAAGQGERAVVAVTSGLLRQLNPRELAGVLAHEISHIRHQDLYVMSLADAFSRVTALLGQAGQILVLLSLPAVFAGYDFPWLGAVILILAPAVSALLQLALSRTREYDADRGAVELTGDPMGLASALVKVEEVQGGWLERIFLPGRRQTQPSLLRTHPHTRDRVARLRELATLVPASTLAEPSRFPASNLTDRARPRWHPFGLWY